MLTLRVTNLKVVPLEKYSLQWESRSPLPVCGITVDCTALSQVQSACFPLASLELIMLFFLVRLSVLGFAVNQVG